MNNNHGATGTVGTIYTASKTRHAAKWRELRALGCPIIATWIDEAGPGETEDHACLARRCIDEPVRAECTLLYAEPGETMKGSLVEVGAALAAGRRVRAVGAPPDFFVFYHHPNWHNHGSVSEALAAEAATPRPETHTVVCPDCGQVEAKVEGYTHGRPAGCSVSAACRAERWDGTLEGAERMGLGFVGAAGEWPACATLRAYDYKASHEINDSLFPGDILVTETDGHGRDTGRRYRLDEGDPGYADIVAAIQGRQREG